MRDREWVREREREREGERREIKRHKNIEWKVMESSDEKVRWV